uniref:amyloid beta precursor like protein 1-like n=1 Tax=Myxine glutinosa TaxID=7769 RepID=UPI00358FE224
MAQGLVFALLLYVVSLLSIPESFCSPLPPLSDEPRVLLSCHAPPRHVDLMTGHWIGQPWPHHHSFSKSDTKCQHGKQQVLDYCRQAYPHLSISNVVEANEPEAVPSWCHRERERDGKNFKENNSGRRDRERSKDMGAKSTSLDKDREVESAKATTTLEGRKPRPKQRIPLTLCSDKTQLAVPFRCLVGEFRSDALLVPDSCSFLHRERLSACHSHLYWHTAARDACSERSQALLTFALFLPCDVDRFRGVEFVCCPAPAKMPLAPGELRPLEPVYDWWDEGDELPTAITASTRPATPLAEEETDHSSSSFLHLHHSSRRWSHLVALAQPWMNGKQGTEKQAQKFLHAAQHLIEAEFPEKNQPLEHDEDITDAPPSHRRTHLSELLSLELSTPLQTHLDELIQMKLGKKIRKEEKETAEQKERKDEDSELEDGTGEEIEVEGESEREWGDGEWEEPGVEQGDEVGVRAHVRYGMRTGQDGMWDKSSGAAFQLLKLEASDEQGPHPLPTPVGVTIEITNHIVDSSERGVNEKLTNHVGGSSQKESSISSPSYQKLGAHVGHGWLGRGAVLAVMAAAATSACLLLLFLYFLRQRNSFTASASVAVSTDSHLSRLQNSGYENPTYRYLERE